MFKYSLEELFFAVFSLCKTVVFVNSVHKLYTVCLFFYTGLS